MTTQQTIDAFVNAALRIEEEKGACKESVNLLKKAVRLQTEMEFAIGTHWTQHYDYGQYTAASN